MTPRLLAPLVLAVCLAAPAFGEEPTASLTGTWRFTHFTAAPWGPPLTGSVDLRGRTLRLALQTMTGPEPLSCGPARLETTATPAEGLFQGVLPAPAETAARLLGLGTLPAPGLRVTCDRGVFEFHRADAETLLLGLDNRVWTLSRAPGAMAPADSPAGRVERLLEAHFGGDMGFDDSTVAGKAAFQSQRLNGLVAGYLARPRPRDEVPPIDGDPYTDSQEYPTRFAVGAARVHGDQARVPVRFADAWTERSVTFELVREAGAWRVNDLEYGPHQRLSDLLTQ